MRIALAQLNPIVGDVSGNLALIVDAIERARAAGAHALMTSELALIGYPPRDLILREGVVEACEQAVGRIAQIAGDMTVIVGHPRMQPGGTRPLRNSASVCCGGRVQAVYDKRLLPGYDVFDEDRYFEPGDTAMTLDISGHRCGIVICEDLWRATDVTAERRYPIEPVAEVARQGCDVLLSLNASPFVLGKWHKHLRQMRALSSDHGMTVVAVNQVGANDDQVFDGRSVVVAPDGRIVHVLRGFEPDLQVVDIPGARHADDSAAESWNDSSREVFHALVLGIRDYVRKTGHSDVLIGLSGGIDSALVAALASAAVGPEHVHGVMMPSRYSSSGSIVDAADLARRLSTASTREIPIHDLHAAVHAALKRQVAERASGVTDENVQARIRGVLLMAMSNSMGGLVLATSNKSEMAVGYSTLYGDMCGALAPLGDMTKTRIYTLCRWINAHHEECGYRIPPIPQSSIDKPPSAELRPNQTDQDSLPPYDVLDEIIERRIELEQDEARITVETGISSAVVRETLRLIDRAQFKRDQAPVLLKITGRAFGPGRPMPIALRERLDIAPVEGVRSITQSSEAISERSSAPVR